MCQDPAALWNEIGAHVEAFHTAQDNLAALDVKNPGCGLPRGVLGVLGLLGLFKATLWTGVVLIKGAARAGGRNVTLDFRVHTLKCHAKPP